MVFRKEEQVDHFAQWDAYRLYIGKEATLTVNIDDLNARELQKVFSLLRSLWYVCDLGRLLTLAKKLIEFSVTEVILEMIAVHLADLGRAQTPNALSMLLRR